MWRPASLAVLTFPLLVAQARAQADARDSVPAFRLSYRYPPVGVPSVGPALSLMVKNAEYSSAVASWIE